jgi:FkbM family methyltransferase
MKQVSKSANYWNYLAEYYRYADLMSIISSVQYKLFGTALSFDRIVESRIGKFYCRGNTTDFMYINYNYEIAVKEFIEKHISAYNTFMDIGACIGDYSIWMAKSGYQCLAFEPIPNNFDSLKRNLAYNGLKGKVKVFPIGLGAKAEYADFEIRGVNKGASKRVDDIEKTSAVGIQIHRLDDIFPQLNFSQKNKVIMKLDVEGMEIDVLRGAKDFIQNTKHLIIIMEATLTGRDELIKYLEEVGDFEFQDIDTYNFAAIKI